MKTKIENQIEIQFENQKLKILRKIGKYFFWIWFSLTTQHNFGCSSKEDNTGYKKKIEDTKKSEKKLC